MGLAGEKLDQPVELAKLLETGLHAKPFETALVSLDRQWTWQELDQASTRLATEYLAMGLVPGDRVASLLPNDGVLLIHYLACFKAGLTATPLNYRYQAAEIDHALQVSEASLLIAHAERDQVISDSQMVGRLALGCLRYQGTYNESCPLEQLLRRESDCPALPPPSSAAAAFIFFTSGSTGKPKGVTHTHETFGWILASTMAGLTLSPDDTFLPATSASHIAASSFSFAGLAAGARVAIARSFGGDEILPLLRTTRPSLLCMLPAPLFGLVRDHNAVRDDFQSIRRCIAGGDKICLELEREFIELTGLAIEEVYGMTETGLSSINPTHGNRIGSIGQLAPGYEASIRNDIGEEVPVDQEGQLWIRFPGNTTGYWNLPDETAEMIVDNWLDTGDLVSADSENYLWFRGRKKQIIVHDGSNICPQEVEDSLLEHHAVAAAGVIGIHDLIHGETVRAYLTLQPEVFPPTAAELIEFSRKRVGYKAPEEIVILPAMPLNVNGKVDRAALQTLAHATVNRHVEYSEPASTY
ncbi:class I adenylate-forming enzyme family protein [Blastopirellula marina]|nr:class I adenylate-forming enzyme family protein [Blastopirellula marina]